LEKEQKSKEVKKKTNYHIPALIAVFAILFAGVFVVGAYIGNNDTTGLFSLGNSTKISTLTTTSTAIQNAQNVQKSLRDTNNKIYIQNNFECNIPDGKYYLFKKNESGYFAIGNIKLISTNYDQNKLLSSVTLEINQKNVITTKTIKFNDYVNLSDYGWSACLYHLGQNGNVVLQLGEFVSYYNSSWVDNIDAKQKDYPEFKEVILNDNFSGQGSGSFNYCPEGYYLINTNCDIYQNSDLNKHYPMRSNIWSKNYTYDEYVHILSSKNTTVINEERYAPIATQCEYGNEYINGQYNMTMTSICKRFS